MRAKTEMEKIVQEGNKKLDELFAKKEQEITN
jgi:ribosome recycling factor